MTLTLTPEQIEALKASIQPKKLNVLTDKEGVLKLLRDNIADPGFCWYVDALSVVDIIEALFLNASGNSDYVINRDGIQLMTKEFVEKLVLLHRIHEYAKGLDVKYRIEMKLFSDWKQSNDHPGKYSKEEADQIIKDGKINKGLEYRAVPA